MARLVSSGSFGDSESRARLRFTIPGQRDFSSLALRHAHHTSGEMSAIEATSGK